MLATPVRSTQRHRGEDFFKDIVEYNKYIRGKCKQDSCNVFCYLHLGDVLMWLALKNRIEERYGMKMHYLLPKDKEILAHLYDVD